MYRDVLTALETFPYRHLTQTTIDDYLQKLHVAPIFGGSDLDPPYALAAAALQEALMLPLSQENVDIEIALEPDLGLHRYDQDAVFVIANTMTYGEIMLFVTTLRKSGFEGDIVLSADIYSTEMIPTTTMTTTTDNQTSGGTAAAAAAAGIGSNTKQLNDIGKLLRYYCQHSAGIVVYDGVIRNAWTHATFSNQMDVEKDYVYLRGLYRMKDTQEILEDERIPRSLGVARFELYWVWSKKYSHSSTILLIDGHDSYFQSGSAVGMGTRRACGHGLAKSNENGTTSSSSVLHIYEENSKNKTHRLAHIENKTMLVASYKVNDVTKFTYNDNVLSAGSTHGDQRAVETYLRAMVKQFDYTQCVKYHCEWAFHNYLYYMGVLWSMPEIDEVRVHMQGTGAVNSVEQDVPLNSSRIYDSEHHTVLNLPMGYGLHPSWCVHQYKADEELYRYLNVTKDKLMQELDFGKVPDFVINTKWMGSNYTILASPWIGKHRPEQDAIFTIVQGRKLNDLAMFVLSARKAGYQGDIVLSVRALDKLAPEMRDFLSALSKDDGIVIYAGLMHHRDYQLFLPNFYADPLSGKPMPDPRPPRAKTIVAFDLYAAWTNKYSPSSRIMILDGEQSFFQGIPWKQGSCSSFELNLHLEHGLYRRFGIIQKQDEVMYKAFETMFQPDEMAEFSTEPLLNPQAIHGHQESVKILISDMIQSFDSFQCYHFGCDWSVLNHLWFTKRISNYDSITYKIIMHKQGSGDIHLTVPGLSFMTEKKLYDPTSKTFKSWKGEVSPIVFRYQYKELDDHFDEIMKQLLSQVTLTKANNFTGTK